MRLVAIAAVLLATSCSNTPSNSARIGAAGTIWQIQGPLSRGSGVPVGVEDGELLLLTAAHIDVPLELPQPGPTTWSALNRHGSILLGGRIVEKHPELDAMLMAFPLAGHPAPRLVELGFEELEFGEDVWGAGWGKSVALWLTEGLANDARRVSAEANPGDSGGGIFDTEGRLRALILGISDPHATYQVWVLPLGEIREWLAGHGLGG